jgi:hypothetical protein
MVDLDQVILNVHFRQVWLHILRQALVFSVII